MNKLLKSILVGIFFMGLIYLILPGPKSINDIPPIPDSLKSTEPGDTIQNPNIAAYFSDYRRAQVTQYYKEQFSYLNFFGLKIPPLRFNHPPEEAQLFVREQSRTLYLEQFAYPFRDALFVNGYEPFNDQGKPFDLVAVDIIVDGQLYTSKTTLRYYPSDVVHRVIIYFGVWGGLFGLYSILRNSFKYYK